MGAHDAAADLIAAFDVDLRETQVRVLEAFKTPRPQAAAKQQFLGEAFKLVDLAGKSEQWDYALDLTAALDKFAGTANADLKRAVATRTDKVGGEARPFAVRASRSGPHARGGEARCRDHRRKGRAP